MPAPTLVTIGDFARMSQLTVKSLRHYHEIGLLVPADIDRFSGYRRYGVAQLPIAQVIRRLRELDMPLDEIRAVLAAPDVAHRDAAISAHLRVREHELARMSATVASLRNLIGGGTLPTSGIRIEQSARQTAVAITREVTVDSFGAWLPEFTHELADAAGDHRDGVHGALFPQSFFEDGGGDVTAYLPVTRSPSGIRGEADVIELPPADFAVIAYTGCGVDVDRSYAALGTYVTERAIGIAGPLRERFLRLAPTPHMEICWPVFPVAAQR